MASKTFEKTVEARTGQTVEHLRETPISEQIEAAEKERGKKLHFVSSFPLVGRAGCVLRDRFVDHSEAEAAVEYVLRDE